MKINLKIFVCLFFSLILVLSYSGHAGSSDQSDKMNQSRRALDIPEQEVPYVEGQVLVVYQSGIGPSAAHDIASDYGLTTARRYQAVSRIQNREYALLTSENQTTEQMIQSLSRDRRIISASPDYFRYAQDTFPNDSNFSSLWGLHNTGQDGGTADIDIDAPEAWDLTTGSSNVVVGVIDSGIDYDHPDIEDNMWENPNEIAGNDVDDDGNGWVDDIYGINTVVNTGDPMDHNGHGTHVAGTIGGTGNNGIGVAGVNWDVKIIAAKFLNELGSGSSSNAIACIDYLVDLKTSYGVNIVAINASYGGYTEVTAERDAINAAGAAGIIFCAAAGNDGTDNDTSPFYPASHNCANILAVTAVNNTGGQFYNYGAATVDLGAPGVTIRSIYRGSYTPASGDFFFDDIESGLGSWTYGGDYAWDASTDTEIFSNPPSIPTFFSDSPGSLYDNNINAYNYLASSRDLSSYAGTPVYIGFQSAQHIDSSDHAYVEVSGDNGATWMPLIDFSGYGYDWWPCSLAVPEKVKTSQFNMRFRMNTDASTTAYGWLYDDAGIGIFGEDDVNYWLTDLSGTSMAAPHVTGAAALLAAYYPDESMAARISRILNNTVPLSSLSGKCVTGGMLNLNNALRDSPVISGTVTLQGSGLENVLMSGLPHTTVTDNSGDYSGYVLSGWSGTVTPALTGYTFSPANQHYSGVTSDQTDQDYSVVTYTISGTVTTGGGGLSGVTMTGLPSAPVTNASGDYSDTVVSGWSGMVTPTLDCYTFTPVDNEYSNVTSDRTGEDYTASLLSYSISGTVTHEASGLIGVNMTGLPTVPVTNASGYYTDTVDCGWSGTVTPSSTGYVFSPVDRSFTDVLTDQTQDFTASVETFLISGNAATSGGSGISGVAMNGLPASPVTDALGDYSGTVEYGWSGTVTPTHAGYTFNPVDTVYSNVTSDQTGEDYTGTLNTYEISGAVTYTGSGLPGVSMTGLPSDPDTSASGTYSDSVDYGWSGTVTPVFSGYTFDPPSRDYSGVNSPFAAQDYTASLEYNSPSHYQVIPEVLWAPAAGGGEWMTEVQITDVTGGSEVSVYFNSLTGDRRGPISLFTGSGPDTSAKAGNLLNTLNALDSGYDYYGKAGAVEFATQDADHRIHVIARTKNGSYSKTFPGLNHNDDNTAGGSRIMMIQNLASNDTFRTAYGGFNPTDSSISVEYALIDEDGNTIGSTFTKTYAGRQYQAVSLFSEAGVPYPDYSHGNVWLKITPVSGSGELMSYGATANNITSDPAVHIAAQASDIGGYNSPSNYQVIPEVLWAPATGGGEWMTEVQITDMTGGSEVDVYFNSSSGDRRGPISLFTGSGAGVSAKAGNLLNILDALDSGFSYYQTAGTVEFVTQDAEHKIQVMARTYNGNYSKTFQGLNLNDANTASSERTLMVQNLVNDDTFRTAFGGFNPTDDYVIIRFILIDSDGNTIGSSFTKTFYAHDYIAFNPFTEAQVPYPGSSYNNAWLKVEVAAGSGMVIVYGATANNVTSDPAVHRAVQH